jgi:hypothetical protein
MVIEPAGNVTVDKVDDEVLGAAGRNVVVLLLKQMGQSLHCRLVSVIVLVLIKIWRSIRREATKRYHIVLV